jgi:predicted amidohydrolase
MAPVADVSENIRRLCAMAGEMDTSTDIFLLPELWTGTCEAGGSDAALEAVCRICRDNGVYAVAGTMPWPSGERLANRAWVVDDAGTPFAFYDKAHLFSEGGENKRFAAGDNPLIFSVKGLDCSVLVSYDIMFPEYSRCVGLAGGQVIFSPARWARKWRGAWETLTRSTAASCQAYVVACNAAAPCGLAPEESFGGSSAVSPWGDVIGSAGEGEGILASRLEAGEIFKCRKQIPLERDRRAELYGMLLT